MSTGKPVFAQIVDFLPIYTFRRSMARCPSDDSGAIASAIPEISRPPAEAA